MSRLSGRSVRGMSHDGRRDTPSDPRAAGGGARAPAHVLTSESVTEGHPDKVCDYIADSILDAYLALDRRSRVACEVLCQVRRGGAGRRDQLRRHRSTTCRIVREAIARDRLRRPRRGLQRRRRAGPAAHHRPVLGDRPRRRPGDQPRAASRARATRASCSATPPTRRPSGCRCRSCWPTGWRAAWPRTAAAARYPWLRPDGKTQVSVVYEDGRPARVSDVLVSTQHARGRRRRTRSAHYVDAVAGAARARPLARRATIRFTVNPTGSFVQGGPAADCGVTGRKIIVDTYGGAARHGGGAFSGKDPSKVDRSGAYFCRYVARQVVDAGLARARRDPGRLRDRRGAAGGGQGRHVRHRRRAARCRASCASFDFRPARDHRAAGPAAADLPADHELRPLRQARPALGGGLR